MAMQPARTSLFRTSVMSSVLASLARQASRQQARCRSKTAAQREDECGNIGKPAASSATRHPAIRPAGNLAGAPSYCGFFLRLFTLEAAADDPIAERRAFDLQQRCRTRLVAVGRAQRRRDQAGLEFA